MHIGNISASTFTVFYMQGIKVCGFPGLREVRCDNILLRREACSRLYLEVIACTILRIPKGRNVVLLFKFMR
jgi:hypothetical protein